MLPDRYLIMGLDALCRSHPKPEWTRDGFVDGHRGAAMISAWYLISDRLVEPESEPHIQAMLDREWADRPLFAPMPAQPAARAELDRLLEALDGVFGTMDHVGHHVIFPTLALRVFRQLPETITAARIDGLLTMARIYTRKQPLKVAPTDQPYDAAAYAAWMLQSFLQGIPKEQVPGIGGHLMTFGQAVMELYEMGYTGLARKAEAGHRDYASANLSKPIDPAQATFPKPDWMRHPPDRAAHWREQGADRLEQSVGHAIKYAYGFLFVCSRARDPDLVAKAMVQYHHVSSGRRG